MICWHWQSYCAAAARCACIYSYEHHHPLRAAASKQSTSTKVTSTVTLLVHQWRPWRLCRRFFSSPSFLQPRLQHQRPAPATSTTRSLPTVRRALHKAAAPHRAQLTLVGAVSVSTTTLAASSRAREIKICVRLREKNHHFLQICFWYTMSRFISYSALVFCNFLHEKKKCYCEKGSL
jgi:hypothetical protein